MFEFFKNLLGLISPIGAQREQINLLTLKNSQLVARVRELEAGIEVLRNKDTANTEEIKKLNNQLYQLNSFKPNAVNPQGVPYRSAAPRGRP